MYDIELYGELEVWLYSVLSSALDEVECSVHALTNLPPGKEHPVPTDARSGEPCSQS